MKKQLKKPDTFKVRALKTVTIYETVFRGSVDENCSAPGSKFQGCKNKCC